MSKDRLEIDLRQEGTSEVFFPQSPVLKSNYSNWSNLYVEHHCQPYWDFPEHRMEWHVICSLLGSSPHHAERWLDGHYQSELYPQSTIAVIPADVDHRSVSNKFADYVMILLNPSYLNQVAQEWDSPITPQLLPYFASQEDRLVFQLGLTLKAEIAEGYPGGRLYGDSICHFLAVHLLKNYSNLVPKIPQYEGGLSKHSLRQVLDYIHSFLDQDLSLEALAGIVGISKFHFINLFKQSMGMTPHQYIIQQRIERARTLLPNHALTISEISFTCGFTNQSHFTRLFRKYMSVTPKVYREQTK